MTISLSFFPVAVGAVVFGIGAVVGWSADPPAKKSGTSTETRPELGRVPWERDFPAAVARAGKEKKPLLVLFDEVPGCQTCQSFGAGPLSHPLVLDVAAEFVPVVVYNNVPGADAEVLKKFKEPVWNNPVVRFLDADGVDLIPRKDGEYTTAFLLPRMARALEKAGRQVPEYLKLIASECAPVKREKAVFAMSCYWEGEAKLGQLSGVIGTGIGTLDGSEVVEIEFDPTVLGYKTLVGKAMEFACADRVFARSDDQRKIAKEMVGNKAVRSDKAIDANTTQQYHLSRYPEYYYLPITALQATRVNSAIAYRESPDVLLTPGQLTLLKQGREALVKNSKVFAGLSPDRSLAGLTRYSAELEKRLAK
jgi:hypothetical protein